MSAARTELARLIKVRAGHATSVEETGAALATLEAEVDGRLSEKFQAHEARDRIQAEVDDAYRRFGGNRARILQHILDIHGRTPDDLLDEAKRSADDADRVCRLAREGAERAEAIKATASDNLRWAEGKIDDAAKAVLLECYPALFEQAKAACAEAARLKFALGFVMRGVNLNAVQHGHELYPVREFLWNANWTTQFDKPGVQPWKNFFEALKSDAKAKPPIELSAQSKEAA